MFLNVPDSYTFADQNDADGDIPWLTDKLSNQPTKMFRDHLDWEVTVFAWRQIVIALNRDTLAIDLNAAVDDEGSDDRLTNNWQPRHSLETVEPITVFVRTCCRRLV